MPEYLRNVGRRLLRWMLERENTREYQQMLPYIQGNAIALKVKIAHRRRFVRDALSTGVSRVDGVLHLKGNYHVE